MIPALGTDIVARQSPTTVSGESPEYSTLDKAPKTMSGQSIEVVSAQYTEVASRQDTNVVKVTQAKCP